MNRLLPGWKHEQTNQWIASYQAEYKCVELALKKGEDNSTTQCMENGEWSSVGLVCNSIPCGPAPQVDNSHVSFFTFNDLIYAGYICDEGFIPEGKLCNAAHNLQTLKDTWLLNQLVRDSNVR